MDSVLNDEEVKVLKYKPHVELVNADEKKYHFFNRLSEKQPCFVFKGNDASQEATIIFSSFVDHPGLIPRYSTGKDGITRNMWVEMTHPGIFRLKDGENLYIEVPVKEGTTEIGESSKTAIAQVKVKPDVLIVDVFTSNLLAECDMHLVVNASNALKVERIFMRETEDSLKNFKFRKDNIIAVNRIIEEHLKELAKLDTKE